MKSQEHKPPEGMVHDSLLSKTADDVSRQFWNLSSSSFAIPYQTPTPRILLLAMSRDIQSNHPSNHV